MTYKTRVEENLEARELLFNMYAVNQAMNYYDEETDEIIENVGLDCVDLFDMYANIYMFNAYDKKNAHVMLPTEEMDKPKDVIVPWSKAEAKMFNHMTNELEDEPINLTLFLAFQRYHRIFSKVGEIYADEDSKLNLEALNLGLELMGLELGADEFAKAMSKADKPSNVVTAGFVDEDAIEEMDEKTPFDYESAFEFAAHKLSAKLEKVKEAMLM